MTNKCPYAIIIEYINRLCTTPAMSVDERLDGHEKQAKMSADERLGGHKKRCLSVKGADQHRKFFERKNSTMKKLNKKGFTIVELVIVIAVIAILAGVLIPTFATVVERANKSAAMQQAKIAYENYLAENADKADLMKDFCIEVGKYYFKVENGQFNATAVETKSYPCVKVEDKAETFTTDASSKVVTESSASASSGS